MELHALLSAEACFSLKTEFADLLLFEEADDDIDTLGPEISSSSQSPARGRAMIANRPAIGKLIQ
jgi:hypothetical protein